MAAATLLVSCDSGGRTNRPAPTGGSRPLVVASFNFPESELIAQIYGQALEHAGVPVRMELDLGTREMVLPAFQTGLVDVVPEYLGSALSVLSQGPPENLSDPSVAASKLAQELAPYGRDLAFSSAQDKNGFAVSRTTAERYGLHTVSDLQRLGDHLRLTGPPECPDRTYCLLGLERVYGLHFQEFVTLDTEQERVIALREGVADVALLFSTDAVLASGDVVFLTDDRQLQPPENVTPIVSWGALQRYDERIVTALDAVSARLTTQGLIFLNSRLAIEGRLPSAEAHGWLIRQGLVSRSS